MIQGVLSSILVRLSFGVEHHTLHRYNLTDSDEPVDLASLWLLDWAGDANEEFTDASGTQTNEHNQTNSFQSDHLIHLPTWRRL